MSVKYVFLLNENLKYLKVGISRIQFMQFRINFIIDTVSQVLECFQVVEGACEVFVFLSQDRLGIVEIIFDCLLLNFDAGWIKFLIICNLIFKDMHGLLYLALVVATHGNFHLDLALSVH